MRWQCLTCAAVLFGDTTDALAVSCTAGLFGDCRFNPSVRAVQTAVVLGSCLLAKLRSPDPQASGLWCPTWGTMDSAAMKDTRHTSFHVCQVPAIRGAVCMARRRTGQNSKPQLQLSRACPTAARAMPVNSKPRRSCAGSKPAQPQRGSSCSRFSGASSASMGLSHMSRTGVTRRRIHGTHRCS